MKIKIEEVKPGELFWISPGYHAQSHVSDAVIMTVADCETPSYVQRGFIVERRNLPDEVWVNRKEDSEPHILSFPCMMTKGDTLELSAGVNTNALCVEVLSEGDADGNKLVVLDGENEAKVLDYLLERREKVAITLEEMEEYSKLKEGKNNVMGYLQKEMEKTARELAASMGITLSEVYTMAADQYLSQNPKLKVVGDERAYAGDLGAQSPAEENSKISVAVMRKNIMRMLRERGHDHHTDSNIDSVISRYRMDKSLQNSTIKGIAEHMLRNYAEFDKWFNEQYPLI